MKQSIEEQQEIPKEESAFMLVGRTMKIRRLCNLAAERRQKMRERTQGNRRSRRKSAPVCRKVSRMQKWHGKKKAHQENSDPGKS
jgi:hypothetical protein